MTVTTSKIGKAVCDALGIDSEQVVEVSFLRSPEEIAKITVVFIPDKPTLDRVIKAMKSVRRKEQKW